MFNLRVLLFTFCLFILQLCIHIPVVWSSDSDDTGGTLLPGDHERFGHGRPSQPVHTVSGFPSPSEFFEKYVVPLKPLKMSGAGKVSPAFKLWSSDSYFLELTSDNPHQGMSVETKKKENRTQMVVEMDFKEFLSVYNTSDHYMVQNVPGFLSQDVVLPCPIQCDQLVKELLAEAIMWFSSGGTKSVVHTDSVDNINCVYRGQKELILVDPAKYGDKVDFDHPEGSYSGIDVDRVDYADYPGLAEVEYYHVNMTAGDCLYIPYKWIHQVRSYNSNIAVNVWWNHHNSVDIDTSTCNDQCDPALSLDKVGFNGFNQVMGTIEVIRDHIVDMIGKETDADTFGRLLAGQVLQNLDDSDIGMGFQLQVLKIFNVLDVTSDGILTREEVTGASNEMWVSVQGLMLDMEALLESIHERLAAEERDEGELYVEESGEGELYVNGGDFRAPVEPSDKDEL